MINKYFIKQFVIYFLLIIWFLFVQIDNTVDKLSGSEVTSTVKFVYEAF